MNSYYAEALRDYAAVTYEALHSYLIGGLSYWYKKFPPSQEEGWADVTESKQMHRSRLRTHVKALSCA